MLAAVVSIGGIGFLAALALGFAARKFAVAVDPREQAIVEVLSGANCGACGYPGCGAYARAVVAGEASASLCTPGGAATIAEVARIMGVAAELQEPQVAVVLCQGDNRRARDKYRYFGIVDCQAAQRLADGPKTCPGGCLGLGSCERACPFGAIEMTANRLAHIHRDKCTGCRKCVAVCPRQVIRMTPRTAEVQVLCNSHDKGALVRKYCDIGCIACHICEKTVPGAFSVENFLAVVRPGVHEDLEDAVAKCPTHCIHDFAAEPAAGPSRPAPRSPGTA